MRSERRQRRSRGGSSARLKGARAEAIAARYLAAHGLEILDANRAGGGGELDLVAREGDEIVFVEVRARRRGARFGPLASVGPEKRARLVKAARHWLARSGQGLVRCRFDIVAVVTGGTRISLRWVRGAFLDEG